MPTYLIRPMSLQPYKSNTRIRANDLAHVTDLHAAMLSQSAPKQAWALYLMIVIVIVLLVWAGFSKVEEITHGTGKIISTSGEQIIQSLEGGILAELNVREGDIVEKGQPLLRIDATRANASYQEGFNKVAALEGTIARLKAEAYNKPLVFSNTVKQDADIVRNETEAYNARLRAVQENIAGLHRGLELAQQEISMTEPMVARGLISDLELLRMKRQANDFRIQMAERTNKYRTDANNELLRMESDLAQSRENLAGKEDTMKRTLIKAPVRGTIKNIKVTTIGGVIQPGVGIMEIVPLGDQLLVETKIRPQDVAFLHPGLPATVKITAYDYAVYGGLTGTVEQISPDTLRDERGQQTTGAGDDTYYKVLVRTTSSTLKSGGKELPIIPGMTTSVEVRSGQKTVLDYLLKPVMKAREAFRER
jgi:membrane fusion protein, adhesin transport system